MRQMSASTQTTIRFTASVSEVGGQSILRLPESASRQLPSRGQVAVEGTVAGVAVQTVLEPDGMRGHWLRITQQLQKAVGAGDTVEVVLDVAPEWPEPDVPSDLAAALAAAPPEVQETWQDITPMARWEWVRWVNATANPATRQRRVEVSISKMDHGKRRPCCFDLSSCTDPSVSRSGKLIGTG
jgi:hypothetical protein